MIILTPNRLRSMIEDCRTEADLEETLRHHKVRFRYSTDSGFLSILVPCSSGTVRVYRTASRIAPFVVAPVTPTPYYRPKRSVRKIIQSA